MQIPTTTFKALGDPTRQQILSLLTDREMTIGEIVDHFEMTRAGVKKHISLLESGNLIKVEINGRERINSLNQEGFRAVQDWIEYFDQFWDDKLQTLKEVITKDHTQ